MGTFNQEKFRELLREGIGSRTQKEFAEKVKMSPVTINRMLNDEVISQPRTQTLSVFAANMTNVKYSELMEACGYDAPGDEELINRLEDDISDFFVFSVPVDGVPAVNKNLEDVIIKLEAFVTGHTPSASVSYIDTGDNNDDIKTASVKVTWKTDECSAETYFTFPYIETKNGHIICMGYANWNYDMSKFTGSASVGLCTIIGSTVLTSKEEKAAAKNLLSKIFGFSDLKPVPTKVLGFGFEVNPDIIPKSFVEYFTKYKDVYCDTPEKTKMYQDIIAGMDINDAIAAYAEEMGVDVYSAYDIIAEILRKKAGKDFYYYEPCVLLEKDSRNAYVMFELEDAFDGEDTVKPALPYVYEAAKILDIKQFGMIIYNTVINFDASQVYDTETFKMN